MLSVSGYDIGGVVLDGRDIVVHRGRRHSDGAPVLIKAPQEDRPSRQALRRLRREEALLTSLDDDRITRAVALVPSDRGLALILEDLGGEPLRRRCDAGPLTIPAFLDLALRLTDALAAVHSHGLAIRDLRPENILLEPGGRVSLIDFTAAAPPSSADAPTVEVDALTYTAPEQTGRLNRPVDERSDLYALGAIFFELLTGRPPFVNEERLELVHSHIAREPPRPQALRPEIPGALAAVVLRLLAKMADERYQSAAGLRHDLERCRDALARDGMIADFPLGERDRPPTLTFADRLYGAEGLIHELLAAHERASRGGREVVLIGGASGSGKSQLVDEVIRGHFSGRGQILVASCADAPETPHGPLIAALRARLRDILVADDDELTIWRLQLRAALLDQGGLLDDLIPEISALLGPLGPAPPLSGPAGAQRLRALLEGLLRTLATAQTPFILVLDDAHRLDPASAEILARIFGDPRGYALLLLATHRGDARTLDPPLRLIADEAAARGATVTERSIEPLSIGDTLGLLRDSLLPAAISLRSLAEHIFARAGGNPLYTRVLLEELHTSGQLLFDRERGAWRWEQDQRGDEADVDVVALLTTRLADLPPATREAVAAASCVGQRFSLPHLSHLLERPPNEVREALAPAIAHGIVRPSVGPYDSELAFSLAHERLAEIAYAGLSSSARAHYHQRLGERLLAEGAAGDDRLFAAVSHLGRGEVERASRSARVELGRLLLLAGQRALRAGAFAAANRNLSQALEVMPQGSWEREHELMLGVHLSLAEVRQVLGEVASAQSLFDRALAETPSPLERAELLIFKIGREIALRRFTDALATGHAALALVGADVPTRGTRAALGVEVVRLRWNLRRRGKRAFLELPESNERRVHVAHSVLMHMTPAAYFTDFKLAAIILLRLANLTLERGRTEHSAYGIAGYGLVLASRPGERAAARELGEIADELLAAHPSPAIEARVDLLVGLFTLPWSGPLREARARLERGYRAALASGDLLYASFCGNHIPPFAFLGGENLGRILDLAAEQSAFLGGIGEREGEAFVGALAGLCRALRGPGPVPTRLRAEDDGEEELAASATRFRRTMGGFYIPLYRGILLFHAGEHAEAQIQFEAATQAITAVRAVPTRVDLDFFAAVNLAELASQAGPEDRGRMLATLSILVERLEGWAAAAPASYGPRWKIAAAAHAWVRGEENEVLPLLNLAITEALDTDDPHRVGVAAELAARVLQSQGITFLVEHYVDQAIAAYDEMGAAAKIASLRAVYGDRTPPTPTLSPAERPRPNPLHTETSTLVPVDGSGSKSLDLGTVIKATQALSGEIVLERLLRALVRIVMESAGARRCFLVLESEGRLLIEGEGSIDPEHVEVLGSTPIEAQSDLPLSIIKYVARAGDKVVLDHAAESGAFTKDPYVREQALKSVLCLPISQQGKVSGVLYLENNLATDVFTDDRLELLNQLAAQVAISIDNARLYDSLDRARREAVSADQAKTRFLMNMSHELRTPLNAIIGYTELIEEELEDGHVANFTDDLGSIRTAALRLERTLESALELSRIEGGTFEIADEIVDLRELVAEVVSELGPSARDRGNRLTIDVDDPGPILGDRIRLRFCLRSLLDNAIRFTEAGEVELRLATDPGHQPPLLELVVRDTGIGIADEHMPRLFDAFTQADDSTTRAYEGSGVSLAVTRHICEAHGGTIAVGSRPGEGSRFTVELPLRRPAASA